MNKTLSSNQQGIAHLLIIVVIVLAIAGGAGYLVYSKQQDKTATKDTGLAAIVNNKAVQDACKREIKDDDFCKFVSNWAGTEGSYTSTITTTGEGDTSVIVFKAESQDKVSTTSTTNGHATAATVTIGKTTYIKDLSDGKWTKYTENDPNVSSATTHVKDALDVTDFSASKTSKVTYKKLGKEACGSLTCFKYQIIDFEAPDTEQFVWFDDKDYVLRHMQTNELKNSSFDMVITYGPVTITAPSPTKDAPDYGSMITPEQRATIEPAAGSLGANR